MHNLKLKYDPCIAKLFDLMLGWFQYLSLADDWVIFSHQSGVVEMVNNSMWNQMQPENLE